MKCHSGKTRVPIVTLVVVGRAPISQDMYRLKEFSMELVFHVLCCKDLAVASAEKRVIWYFQDPGGGILQGCKLTYQAHLCKCLT